MPYQFDRKLSEFRKWANQPNIWFAEEYCHIFCSMHVTKTRDLNTGPRTEDLGTQGLENSRTWDRTQGHSCVALSSYDKNATCVNVLSSNLQLYHWSPHCYTQKTLFTLIMLFHTICLASLILTSLCKVYCMQYY